MRHLGKNALTFKFDPSELSDNKAGVSAWNFDSKQIIVKITLILTDFMAIALSLLTALIIRFWLSQVIELGNFKVFGSMNSLLYALLLWPIIFLREGLYPGYGLTSAQELRKLITGSFYAGSIFAIATVLFYDDLPIARTILVFTVFFSIFFLPLSRAMVKRVLFKLGLWGSQVIVLGAGDTGKRIVKALKRRPLEGLHPVAIFDDNIETHQNDIDGVPIVSSLSQASLFARKNGIDHIVIAIPSMKSNILETERGIKRHSKAFKYLYFVPDVGSIPAEDVKVVNLDGLIALQLRNGLHSRSNQLIKRLIDFLGCSLGILFLLPLVFIIYILIRLDSKGSAFYWSERMGQNGNIFQCLKFRTMHEDAEQRLIHLVNNDQALREEYELFHKLTRDPRVTRVGKVLRKYSLDELPQLYNVFIGNMSLVGPRPYLTRELSSMNGFAETILEAKPGITGFWQISGRNNITFEDRLQMEASYVRSWSIWWDIIILYRTIGVVIKSNGAK